MRRREPKCYQVSDDETSTLVWHEHRISAHKAGANEIGYDDDDFLNYTYCHRAPEFDEYWNKDLPIWVLVAYGWWFECHGCGMTMSEDEFDEHDMKVEDIVGTFKPSTGGFCCERCKEDYFREEHEKRQTKAMGIDWLKARIEMTMTTRQGVEFDRPHAYACAHNSKIHLRDVQMETRIPIEGAPCVRVDFRADRKDKFELYVHKDRQTAIENWWGKPLTAVKQQLNSDYETIGGFENV